jgi:hypothetical protein
MLLRPSPSPAITSILSLPPFTSQQSPLLLLRLPPAGLALSAASLGARRRLAARCEVIGVLLRFLELLGDPLVVVRLAVRGGGDGLGSLLGGAGAALLLGLRGSEPGLEDGVSATNEGSGDDDPEKERLRVKPRGGGLDNRDGLVVGSDARELLAVLEVDPDSQAEVLRAEPAS